MVTTAVTSEYAMMPSPNVAVVWSETLAAGTSPHTERLLKIRFEVRSASLTRWGPSLRLCGRLVAHLLVILSYAQTGRSPTRQSSAAAFVIRFFDIVEQPPTANLRPMILNSLINQRRLG